MKYPKLQNALFVLLFIAFTSTASAQPDALWAHRLSVTEPIFSFGKNLKVQEMVTDEAGNVYLLGFHRAGLELDGNLLSGDYDGAQTAFLAKFSAEGGFQWQRLLTMGDMKALIYKNDKLYVGGEVVPAEYGPLSLEPGPQGVTVGNLFALGHRDAFIAVYDTEGNLGWAETYGGEDSEALDKGDFLHDMAVAEDGTIYFTGSFHIAMDFGSGEAITLENERDANSYLAAVDENGEVLWYNYWPGSVAGNLGNTTGSALALNAEGQIFQAITYTTGGVTLEDGVVFNEYGGTNGTLLLKYTQGGIIIWYQNVEAESGHLITEALATDGSGHLYFCYSHTGEVRVGGSQVSQYFQEDDGAIKTGVCRFAQNGDLQWANSYFCSDADMAVAPDGSAYFSAALFRNSIWLSSYTELKAGSPGTISIWFQLKGTGQLAWGKLPANADSPMLSTNHAITIDEEEYIYATATFNEPLNFGNDILLETGYETNQFDALYFLKLDKDALAGQAGVLLSDNWKVYPNPATTFITMEIEERGDLLIYNSSGQLVLRKMLEKGNQTVGLDMLATGIYFMELRTENGAFRQRLILD